MTIPEDWAPDACTLPTAERPLRVAEFDEFFTAVKRFDRPQPTRLDLAIPKVAEADGRDLADRESQCCSFFAFEFEPDGEDVVMHVGVPPSQIEVLNALEARLAGKG
jgi:hypothetical protein